MYTKDAFVPGSNQHVDAEGLYVMNMSGVIRKLGTVTHRSIDTFSMVGSTLVFFDPQGNPADSTQVFNIYMFRIFGEGLYAQASAMSLVLFAVVVVIAIPVILGMRRRERVLL